MNDFLFNILAWIRSWVGSWGWSMVVFTIMVRLVLTPLDIKSRVSMRKTSKLQPQMQALQKKYANDKEKLNQKTAELYKKEHVNPLSSCLPLLLTWPILIAVFGAMRLAANKELLVQLGQILNNEMPTLERWLWIKNLWMPDSIFAAALPDAKTLQQIPADQWAAWFKGLDPNSLPILIRDLGLTADSFAQGELANTIPKGDETERSVCGSCRGETRLDFQPADYPAFAGQRVQRPDDPADPERREPAGDDQDHGQ